MAINSTRFLLLHLIEELIKTEKNAFDAVCTMETIEHVDHPADFLKACCGLVKVTNNLSNQFLS